MFLKDLSSKEKQLFLQMCLHISHSDNIFTDEEKLMIDTLCNEMSITASYDINLSFDDVLEKLKDIKSLSKKKSIIFELAGVVMADEAYAEPERELMIRICEALEIDYSVAEESVKLISQMAAIYRKASVLVHG